MDSYINNNSASMPAYAYSQPNMLNTDSTSMSKLEELCKDLVNLKSNINRLEEKINVILKPSIPPVQHNTNMVGSGIVGGGSGHSPVHDIVTGLIGDVYRLNSTVDDIISRVDL